MERHLRVALLFTCRHRYSDGKYHRGGTFFVKANVIFFALTVPEYEVVAISHEDSDTNASTPRHARRVRRNTAQAEISKIQTTKEPTTSKQDGYSGSLGNDYDSARRDDFPFDDDGRAGVDRALKLSLQAFGKRLRLNLMKNEDFQRRVEGLKMYTMSSTSKGGKFAHWCLLTSCLVS